MGAREREHAKAEQPPGERDGEAQGMPLHQTGGLPDAVRHAPP